MLKEFIMQNSHLSNEEMLKAFAKVAYDKGWADRDGEETIEASIGDVKQRDEWLNSL